MKINTDSVFPSYRIKMFPDKSLDWRDEYTCEFKNSVIDKLKMYSRKNGEVPDIIMVDHGGTDYSVNWKNIFGNKTQDVLREIVADIHVEDILDNQYGEDRLSKVVLPEELKDKTPISISQLLQLKPEEESCDIAEYLFGEGLHFNHVPEVSMSLELANKIDDQYRIKIKLYKNFHHDFKRFWRLGSVWLDDRPVMIIQNAGRYGDDHQGRYIINFELYKKMVQFIYSLVLIEDEAFKGSRADADSVDIKKKDYKLTEFYGNNLFGYFERY